MGGVWRRPNKKHRLWPGMTTRGNSRCLLSARCSPSSRPVRHQHTPHAHTHTRVHCGCASIVDASIVDVGLGPVSPCAHTRTRTHSDWPCECLPSASQSDGAVRQGNPAPIDLGRSGGSALRLAKDYRRHHQSTDDDAWLPMTGWLLMMTLGYRRRPQTSRRRACGSPGRPRCSAI